MVTAIVVSAEKEVAIDDSPLGRARANVARKGQSPNIEIRRNDPS